MRKHSGLKPYKCTYENCESAFKFSEALRLHMKYHKLGTDQFECHICKVQFTRYIALKSHLKTHDFDI